MRMRDLAAASGVPSTTIHHYLREGVLPPPEKTAANAARYGPAHLERLALIRALRSAELGPFSIRQIREILALIDGGMDPGLAAITYQSVSRSSSEPLETTTTSAADVASATGLTLEKVEGLLENGLLIAGADGELDPADKAAAERYARILALTGLDPEDLSPIADLLHELARYEDTISRVAEARMAGHPDGGAIHDLHRMFQRVHEYLIIRHRSARTE